MAAIRRALRACCCRRWRSRYSAPGPGDQFAVWGWRIAVRDYRSFWSASAYGFASASWRLRCSSNCLIRTRSKMRRSSKSSRKQPKEIILSALLRMSEQAPFYIFTAFIFAYAVGTLKMDAQSYPDRGHRWRPCVSFFTIPMAGHLSDKIGRKKMYLIGVVPPWACSDSCILPWWTRQRQHWCSSPSCCRSSRMICNMVRKSALIAEPFTPRLRYSGASLGYQLASIIAGGPSPIIATALFASYHSGYAIADVHRCCAVSSV